MKNNSAPTNRANTSPKMKLIRTSTVPGSLNTFCRGLLRELCDEGYEVVAVSSPGDKLQELAVREDIRTIAVPMERHISPLKDLKSLWRLIKAFRREKPQIIHSITPKAGLLSMLAGWICRVPVRLHTFTGLVFPTSTGFKRRLLILTDRITCSCATHIVPEGEGVKNDLLNFRITRKTLRVLGHGNIRGIDLEHYDPSLAQVQQKAMPLKANDAFTFIFIGRLVGDKGVNELIAAFKAVAEKGKKVRLILVGEQEPVLDPLKAETASEIKSNQAILSPGRQDDVRPWLAAADALILPSYREGFPNVVIEAGAMGLPCIVTDINGSREIIKSGTNGLIIPPRDVDALVEAMTQFVDNSEQVRQMAQNARPLIASRFEQGYVRKCLKDFYKEILQESL